MTRRLVVFVAVAALLATAAYLLIYLYRWEWHRALVAGVFMLTLQIGLGFAVLLDRLHRIEARLNEAEHRQVDATQQMLAATAPEPAEPFAWLRESSTRMSVFVPILLGAGVILSVLAWAVERVARATASPALERALALRLQPLTMPAGTLFGGATPPLPPRPAGARRPSWRVLLLLGAGAPAFLFASGIDRLADATQNRPDALAADSAGRVVLRLEKRNAPNVDAVALAGTYWGACQSQIGMAYRLTGVEAFDAGRVELLVRPAIGRYAERRLRGCFEDATTDTLRAKVVEVGTR